MTLDPSAWYSAPSLLNFGTAAGLAVFALVYYSRARYALPAGTRVELAA
jgi:hypothetical protein